MRKFFKSLAAVLIVCFPPVRAQQLPDPHFEDWSGAQFASTAQPKYWNFSNVSQLGVDKNFAHQATGRSGKALKIQDQFVGVGSIGATSPGYVALGHPWAYVSSLTSINDATAGTYGGISWTHRPDSMVVWIKRYYDGSVDQAAGDHIKDEHFHLLYYAWSGTSQGESYKAKNLSCTNLSSAAPQYCVDEESDIRLALDGNECGTPKTQAKQIAEGWFYQKKAYNSWTRIVVPIYYFNDDQPTKCNVILSAGRYPDFRANTGQYAGSTLEVDDITLIYSSKIQKVYIGGREWKAFDPDNTTGEQIYSLGQGATTIPEISLVRGAGSLTNTRGGKATFPGRRLGASEYTIVNGQVDGEPTTITVTANDNSSTTTYRIKFVSQASNNARLSDIQINGESLSGFNAYLTSYNVSLPYGTTSVPVVSATPQDGTATVQINQPTSVNGNASIVVTAGDGTTKQTYNLAFSVAPLTDVTLKNIFVDGTPLAGYQPNKSNYNVSLPLSTVTAPTITWESAYPAGVQQIQLLNNTLEGGAQIQVSIPGTTLSKTYKLTYKIEASSYSYLAGIALDGTPLEGFQPEQTVYSITLPLGTTVLPTITYTAGDPYQTITLTEGGVDGTTRIEVKAASGATTTYRLQFRTEKSTNNALAAIAIDGTDLADFDPEVLSYTLSLPAGTKMLPAITYTPGDAYQTVNIVLNQALWTARLTVTAGDGSTRQYVLNFEVQKSENAFLQMIYLNGAELTGFEPTTLNYSLVWEDATMPKITVLAGENQAITISTPSSYGMARIVVTPEEGTPNIYTVRFNSPDQVVLPPFPTDSFPASSDASLAGLYIGGQSYDAFLPDVYEYNYPLPWRTKQVPAVVPVAGANSQIITVAHGAVDRTTTITVHAEDGHTTATYRIAFPVAKSSNTALNSVEIDGVDNFAFDPAVHTYTNIQLPYGTTASPAITAEKAEPEQALTISEAPIGSISTIVVRAEDGSEATYSFSYSLEMTDKPNTLLSAIIDGYGSLDLSTGTEFQVDLPYGTTSFDILSVVKNYPEQEVRIVNGGIAAPTVITVQSMNPAEADAVYTLTPHVNPYDPAQLTDIQADGVTIPNFRPDVYNYVLSVSDALPAMTYTAQPGAVVYDDLNTKRVVYEVEAGEKTHTYTVTFYFPGDLTFDLGFENWHTFTSNPEGRDGDYPHGWNATINAPTTYPDGVFGSTKGYYWPEENVKQSTKHTEGSKSAQVQTVYITKASESMPGILSLSPLSISLGYYQSLINAQYTAITFGDARTFRNTPDRIQIDYNIEKYNKVSGWQFIYKVNGTTKISGVNNFSGKTKNQWYTFSEDLNYAADFIPDNLDIQIVSAETLIPKDYRIGAGGASNSNHFTSTMYFDNLRLNYSSVLTGVAVNGAASTIDGTNISATIDADYYGTPALAFTHAVADQMPVVTWSDELNGVRTATIRNYAEDLSYTDYTLTVTRPQSAVKTCSYTLSGRDLTVVKGSPYQTVAITTNDTAYVISVTAENGDEQTYYAAWESASSSAHVTEIAAETSIEGESTAKLMNLTVDPVLNYDREFDLDSVFMTMTSQQYVLRVFGTADDTTYTIDRNPSDNALLASMSANNTPMPEFYSETYDYLISLPSLDAFDAVPEDPEADVRYVIVPVNADYQAIYVEVTAPNGVAKKRYSVLANIRTLSSEAYLTAITADDVMLTGFAQDSYSYDLNLPAHSPIPQLASIACAGATVETQTVPNGSSAVVTFTVTSEDETVVRTYTVNVNVQPSEVCTLSELFVGGNAVTDFAPAKTDYSIELPYGTTTLPEVDYILTDNTATATKNAEEKSVTILVTAEDGVHQTSYTIVFTIAKSTNADLASIALDGTPLAEFFADEHAYTISLPFGTPTPLITAEAADPVATVAIEGTTITVTAEDGVTTGVYTLTFTYLPSTNAELQAINLDGVLQKGYQPSIYEYADTVLYGAPMPVVTWVTGDEQQVVDTTWVGDTELTIAVTAGDGTTTAEYILTFTHKLSSNCRLADLQINGVTVEGFDPDSMLYIITYPIATPEDALFGQDAVSATPEDKDATVTITMDGTTAQILVTAADGTRAVYVIEQEILQSSESRLEMVWLDGAEVRNYDPDTLEYTIILPQGTNLPTITATPIDTLAEWDQSMPVEIENGMEVQLFCTAQDGSTTVYILTFTYADWVASATVDTDDYLFYYYGDHQFKAVTIGIGVQVGIYDMSGRLLKIEDVPTADPADVEVMIDNQGNQKLISVAPSAAGTYFQAASGNIYFYVFFDSKTKKIAKGGKFGMR